MILFVVLIAAGCGSNKSSSPPTVSSPAITTGTDISTMSTTVTTAVTTTTRKPAPPPKLVTIFAVAEASRGRGYFVNFAGISEIDASHMREAIEYLRDSSVDAILVIAPMVAGVDALKDLEVLDDTLIFYIIGDNGASAEGALNGCYNEMTTLNGMPGIAAAICARSR